MVHVEDATCREDRHISITAPNYTNYLLHSLCSNLLRLHFSQRGKDIGLPGSEPTQKFHFSREARGWPSESVISTSLEFGQRESQRAQSGSTTKIKLPRVKPRPWSMAALEKALEQEVSWPRRRAQHNSDLRQKAPQKPKTFYGSN